MTSFLARIIYNTAVNSRSPRAYAVQITPTDAPLSALHSVPSVVNNRAVTEGVYPTASQAAAAVSAYIATPHVLAAYTDVMSGETRIRVEGRTREGFAGLGWTRRVLASVSHSGTFVAA